MGFFDFLRPKAGLESQKSFSLATIKSMIDLTLPKTDADQLNLFLDEQVGIHAATKSALTERDLFTAQELIDFMYKTPIYFYGFFDWKEESQAFDTYLRRALKRNFDLTIFDTPICDLTQRPAIDQVYQLYGTELAKHQIMLCHIDVDSDSYQIMLIPAADYLTLAELVNTLGYQAKHYSENW